LPGMYEWIIARTRFYDELLAEQLRAGLGQLVLLGRSISRKSPDSAAIFIMAAQCRSTSLAVRGYSQYREESHGATPPSSIRQPGPTKVSLMRNGPLLAIQTLAFVVSPAPPPCAHALTTALDCLAQFSPPGSQRER